MTTTFREIFSVITFIIMIKGQKNGSIWFAIFCVPSRGSTGDIMVVTTVALGEWDAQNPTELHVVVAEATELQLAAIIHRRRIFN